MEFPFSQKDNKIKTRNKPFVAMIFIAIIMSKNIIHFIISPPTAIIMRSVFFIYLSSLWKNPPPCDEGLYFRFNHLYYIQISAQSINNPITIIVQGNKSYRIFSFFFPISHCNTVFISRQHFQVIHIVSKNCDLLL